MKHYKNQMPKNLKFVFIIKRLITKIIMPITITPFIELNKSLMPTHANITMKKNNTIANKNIINMIIIVFLKDIICACNMNFIC